MADQAKLLFYNKMMDRTAIKHLIRRLISHFGITFTANILDQIKTLGFHQATNASISLGIDDLLTVPLKSWLIRDAEKQGYRSEQHHRYGSVHSVEKLRQLIETWYATSEYLKQEMNPNFRMIDPSNPVHMMSFSGARGSISQVHQLVGMRGLMSDPQGQIIDSPIQNNFREGLSITEYIISCYGARKGVVDTAVRTSDAGYLTRRLVEVVQHIVVRKKDCGTLRGILLNSNRDERRSIQPLSQQRLIGRVLADNVYFNMRCIATRNQDISNELARRLVINQVREIYIRSPLTCKSMFCICQLCYGWNLTYNNLVELGEAVGIIAGQSIGEPGTQLTLRTFHTGGVFTGDIAEHIRTPSNGIIKFNENLVYATRTRHGHPAWLCQDNLPVSVENKEEIHNLIVPAQSLLLVQNNQYVGSKQIIGQVRTTKSPLKERVKKPIYSNLDGEVHWDTVVSHLSEHKHNNIHRVVKSGHIWILSGKLHNLSKTSFFFYQNRDKIHVQFPSITNSKLLPKFSNGDIKRDSNFIDSNINKRESQTSNFELSFSRITPNPSDSTILFSNIELKRNRRKNRVILLLGQVKSHYEKKSSSSFVLDIPNNGILNQGDILAISENPQYQTVIPGIIKYGTIKVDSVGKREYIGDDEKKTTFRSRYKILKEGNFFLIPEEVYTIYQPSSHIFVSNNSIIEPGTQITFNITSRRGGLVQIKKVRKIIEIRILPGNIYYPKRLHKISKQTDILIPPGQKIVDEFKSDYWVYLQWITPYRKKTFLLVRPVIEYIISNHSFIEIPSTSAYWRYRDIIQVQAAEYIFYEDGEEVRIRNNASSIQLVQTCLVVNWKEPSVVRVAYVSPMEIIFNNIKKTFLQISLIEFSNAYVRRGNSRALSKCFFNNQPLYANNTNNHLLSQFPINNPGVIRRLSDQGTDRSLVVLFPSDLSQRFSSPCHDDRNKSKQFFGLKYTISFCKDAISERSNTLSLFFNRKKFLKRKKKLTNTFSSFDQLCIIQTTERLGLLGTTHSITHYSFYSHRIVDKNLVLSKQLDIDDSKAISQNSNWFFIDENKVICGNDLSNRTYHSSVLCDVIIPFVNLGQFICEGVSLYKDEKSYQSGQIIAIYQKSVMMRLSKPYLATEGATVHSNYGDILKEGDTLITLIYERLRSGDIIQGLPKVEQLLEARSINSVLLEKNFLFWNNSMTRLVGNFWSHFLGVKTSIEQCQMFLVNKVQNVYRSQGVQISDKHIEIIVRQMTSKVITLEDGMANVSSPGELIELSRAQRMNRALKESICHKPIVLGMTKASLNTTSFISEASFQETTRVLSRAALQGRIDWLKGLKENVVLGSVVPTGTGSGEVICQIKIEKRKELGSIKTKNDNIFIRKIRDIFFYHEKVSISKNRKYIHMRLKKPVLKEINTSYISNYMVK
uniref:DNA-directed RNA polymerase subunit beta'' n=1 Tax=Christensenia aesculifolia TaxID=491817 RepID=A0A5C0F7I1_9MONI|nr:RNA polymerase beta subunit [Christensenia aesculifolia]QEI60320.1 RNA polymerase beta subunit [Christensenia aesculifolia]